MKTLVTIALAQILAARTHSQHNLKKQGLVDPKWKYQQPKKSVKENTIQEMHRKAGVLNKNLKAKFFLRSSIAVAI